MTSDSTQLDLHLPAPPVLDDAALVPARMVNEFVYCPRLAYLMWTQAEWGDSADTVDGRRVHARADKPGRPLPPPECVIRRIPAGHSDASQPVIPTEASR